MRYMGLLMVSCALLLAPMAQAQQNELVGRAASAGGGILNGSGDQVMFVSVGQPGAGKMTRDSLTLCLGVIRPSLVNFLSVSGTISYYNTSPYRSVDSVELLVTGQRADSVLTDTAGYYGLDSLPAGSYVVTPGKQNNTQDASVTPYDASLILRYLTSQILLDSFQRIAADVSGNGEITSFDASYILRYSIGSVPNFPAGDWTFRPVSRTYDPLAGSMENEDYSAVLYGDVSGNWGQGAEAIPMPRNAVVGGSVAAMSNSEDAVRFDAAHSSEVVFRVTAAGTHDVVSGDIVVTFDTNSVSIVDVQPGASVANYQIAWRRNGSSLRICLAGTRPLSGNVELATVRYTTTSMPVVKPGSAEAPLRLTSMMLNERMVLDSAKTRKHIAEGVEGERGAVATELLVLPSEPNPTTGIVWVRYVLPQGGSVEISIYDAQGRLVRSFSWPRLLPGHHSVKWDGCSSTGARLPSGTYFCRVVSNGQSRTSFVRLYRSRK